MQILALAAVIMGIWLVLDHFRKKQVTQDILNLQKQALEKGMDAPALDKLLRLVGPTNVSLRVAIISLCLGLALVAVSAIIPSSAVDAQDAILVFRVLGILAGALGFGFLLTWILIDRPKR
jgi:hypothetical protein